ncbi:MAG: tetratricopeptide repeat protein [Rhodospirillaceae bacterium]|nr:tetratricopeptide repeat protein [Rhodospirillaceae bacterium]
MEILGLLVILIQILFAVHVVRTGRPFFWIFVIVFVPLLGCAIYFVVAVLPDMTQTRTAHRAAAGMVRAVDPGRDRRRLQDAFETADTVDNRRALADLYIDSGEPLKAIELYEGALVGVHRDDPVLLFGLARAQFASDAHESAAATLERLRAANPGYDMPAADLLLARALEASGRNDEAEARYADAVARFPGAEARSRYGVFLKRVGRNEEGDAMLQEVVRGYERSGRPFRQGQREWYELARRHLG